MLPTSISYSNTNYQVIESFAGNLILVTRDQRKTKLRKRRIGLKDQD